MVEKDRFGQVCTYEKDRFDRVRAGENDDLPEDVPLRGTPDEVCKIWKG